MTTSQIYNAGLLIFTSPYQPLFQNQFRPVKNRNFFYILYFFFTFNSSYRNLRPSLSVLYTDNMKRR